MDGIASTKKYFPVFYAFTEYVKYQEKDVLNREFFEAQLANEEWWKLEGKEAAIPLWKEICRNMNNALLSANPEEEVRKLKHLEIAKNFMIGFLFEGNLIMDIYRLVPRDLSSEERDKERIEIETLFNF